MYFVHLTVGEHFFLHLLLIVVPGVTSFEHLRIVNDIKHLTFQDVLRSIRIVAGECKMGHVHVGNMYRLRRKEVREFLCDSLIILLSIEIGSVMGKISR
jgi:hypothetical protein